MSYGPNYRIAESFSQVEGSSAVAGTCDITDDCDTSVIYDSNSYLKHHNKW